VIGGAVAVRHEGEEIAGDHSPLRGRIHFRRLFSSQPILLAVSAADQTYYDSLTGIVLGEVYIPRHKLCFQDFVLVPAPPFALRHLARAAESLARTLCLARAKGTARLLVTSRDTFFGSAMCIVKDFPTHSQG
jgi:hypothetical protein